MATIRFKDPDEFIQELRRDSHRVERHIVRVTYRFTPTSLSPNIRHVHVIATAKVGDDVVELSRYVGDDWGEGFDNKALDRANDLREHLERELKTSFHVRAGVIACV